MKITKNINFEYLKDKFKKDDLINFADFVNNGICGDNNMNCEFISDIIEDKDKRREIHLIIKEHFPYLLSSSNDNKIIIKHKPKLKRKRKSNNILQCTMEKNNIEHTNAIYYISNQLGISPNYISFAATKDKKAITTQLITINNLTLNKLKRFVNNEHVKIGDFKIVDKQLDLGDLYGNYFNIKITNIDLNNETELIKSINNFKENGFINYFGEQRTGYPIYNILTYDIGHSLLQNDYKKALEQILTPQITLDNSFMTEVYIFLFYRIKNK